MSNNIFQQALTPNKPSILKDQRVNVYVPTASATSVGVASFTERDFNVNNGVVSLIWPEQMKVEKLADPLLNVGYIKVLEDEFENTGVSANVINPITGTSYNSSKAEVKLKRKGRDATTRPDLILVSSHDFEVERLNDGNILHKIKINDTFEEPSLVQVDTNDFKRNDGIVQVAWPYAHNNIGTINTNGYGLVKIAPNSQHYLTYIDGVLAVDSRHLFETNEEMNIAPVYTGTPLTGFIDRDNYIDAIGRAKRNEKGNLMLSITKEAVGLKNVANRSFASWEYNEFGEGMQKHFSDEFGAKLDKNTWNSLFNDWTPPSVEERTPQLRLDKLVNMHNAQQEQIDTLLKIKSFLGYFEKSSDLIAAYAPSAEYIGYSAYILSTDSYWSIRQINGSYEWYDTGISREAFTEYIETDPKSLRANGEPSVGSSGKWAQSDHIHPTDLTRLAVSTYKATNVTVDTEFNTDRESFKFNFWNEDINGAYQENIRVNIPYVRKSQGIHNWAGSHGTFVDSEITNEKVWVGSLEDYTNEESEIPVNSLIFVNDGDIELSDEEQLVSVADMYKAGIYIDADNQHEKIITVPDYNVEELVGSHLTLKIVDRGDQKAYQLVKKEDTYTANRILVTNKDTGKIEAGNIIPNHLVTCYDKDIAAGIMVPHSISTSGITEIRRQSFPKTQNILVVTAGDGGIKSFSGNGNSNSIPVINANGALDILELNADNMLVSEYSTETTILPSNQILISGNGNTVSTYNSGNTKGKLLVADGNGALTTSNIEAGKLLYTSAEGTPAAFSMSPGDAGMVLSVDNEGNPTLSNLPTIPTNLPLKVINQAPEISNTAGLIAVVLDEAPTTMYPGYLYLW